MTTLANAPLIEVATQFRWGMGALDDEGNLTFEFGQEETAAFPTAFGALLGKEGFTRAYPIAEPYEDVPFAFSRQFRRNDTNWPAIQSGLGVIGVHQANDGYKWEIYRDNVVRCFDLASQALEPLYSDNIPFFGIELTYLDGFALEEGETAEGFLREKIKAQFHPPRDFLDAPFIEQGITSASFSFSLPVATPSGATLYVALDHTPELLDERPGFYMDTRVRTVDTRAQYTKESVFAWLEEAHAIQQHAFQTLIKPAFLRSFQ